MKLTMPALRRFGSLDADENPDIIGVEWNANQPSPTLRRIDINGDTVSPPASWFDQHPIYGQIKRCVINPATLAVTYGSNARGDGLDLTGASGQVMVSYPAVYARSMMVADKIYRWWVSPTPEDGFTLYPWFFQRGGRARSVGYLGAYAGSFYVDPATGTLKFNSVTGRQPWTGGTGISDGIFRLGFNTGSTAPVIGQTVSGTQAEVEQGIVEGIYVSGGSWAGGNAAGILYLSRPPTLAATARDHVFVNGENLQIGGSTFAKAVTGTYNANYAISMQLLEGFANNHGTGWGIQNVWGWSLVQLLMYIEYATLDLQTALGKGIVDKAGGTGFNGENTGYQESMGTNGTGMGTGTNGLTSINWRGLWCPWSDIWYYLIGFNSLDAQYRIAKRDGTGTLAESLAAGSYESSSCVPLTGNSIPSDPMEFYQYGYATDIEPEDLLRMAFVPKSVVGGGSTTYLCDYAYSHYKGGTRVLLAGGGWNAGASAGAAFRGSSIGVGYSYRFFGARPEFLP